MTIYGTFTAWSGVGSWCSPEPVTAGRPRTGGAWRRAPWWGILRQNSDSTAGEAWRYFVLFGLRQTATHK